MNPTQSKRVCIIEGCGRRYYARGWCSGHYRRWKKTGDVRAHHPIGAPRYETENEAFWSKVEKSENGCWKWRGYLATNGYGRFCYNYANVAAHRYAYEQIVGPIPDGLELDHVKARGCTSRACVNPDHLEPVTHRENTLRGDTITAAASARTHCPRGHELSPENLVPSSLKKGRRGCLTCSREKAAERRRRAA